MQSYFFFISLHLPKKFLFFCIKKPVDEIQSLMPSLRNTVQNILPFSLNDLNKQILNRSIYYYPRLFLLICWYSCPNALLHLAISSTNVLVLGGCLFLHVTVGVAADTSGAKTYIAFLWIRWDVPLEQKLEINSLGWRSQKVRLKSIIFYSNFNNS